MADSYLDPTKFNKADMMQLMCASIVAAGALAQRFEASRSQKNAFDEALEIVTEGVDAHFRHRLSA